MSLRPLQLLGGLYVQPAEIEVEHSRSSGPGGQHVNKTETKVTLRFDLGASSLPPYAKDRIRGKLASRLTKNGELLVSADAHRERGRNLSDALDRLEEILSQALFVEKRRKKTKPSRGAKERRLAGKRARSERKQNRRVQDD